MDELAGEIKCWEPDDAEVVSVITRRDEVERIIKHEGLYFLYRYFVTSVSGMNTIVCSVDLNGVDADRVIQHLGEQL
jgi:hypothetical protein